jgi:DNA-directed RNA polymerase subunit RPC12/RpoP
MTYECQDCGSDVTLETDGRLLHASCQCRGRYVKVKTVLPDGWSE